MLFKTEHKLLIKKIKEYDNIIIAKHKNPDWDAEGSAIGMAQIIKENFKNKNIFIAGDRIDKTCEFSKNKITEEIAIKSLLITVDTSNRERLDFDFFMKVKEIFKIDHHLIVDKYAENNLVDITAMSCTQVIALWAAEMKLKINSIAAYGLYKGLLTDSGRFLYSQTSANTFKAAQVLIDARADLERIHNELYVIDLKLKQWSNFVFSKLELTKKGVGYVVISKEEVSKWPNLTLDEMKYGLGALQGIKEIKISALIFELPEEIKVSLRSRDFAVVEVAQNFNGGGHKLAAGAKLEKITDVKKLVDELEKLITKKVV